MAASPRDICTAKADAPVQDFEMKKQRLETDSFSLVLVRVIDFWDPARKEFKDMAAVIHSIALYLLVAFTQTMVTVMLIIKTNEWAREMEKHWHQQHFHGLTMGGAAQLISHAVQVNNSSALPHDFFVHDGVLDRCKIQLQIQYYQFYYLMVFIWFAQMLIEARSCWSLLECLLMVRAPPSETTSLVERDKETQYIAHILYLPCWIRVLLISALPTVKILVCVGVTIAGAKFLILQVDEVKLLLKVLCMNFVVHIDEVFVKAFLGARTVDELTQLRIVYKTWWPAFDDEWEKKAWGAYFYLSLPFFGLLLVETFFSDLFQFRRACWAYHTHFGLEGVAHIHLTFIGISRSLLN